MDLDKSTIQVVLPVDDIIEKLLDMANAKDLLLKDMLIGWIKDRMYVEMDISTPDPPR